MKSRHVSLRKNPAGSPENKKISYPGKGTRFGKHLFFTYLKIEYTLWYTVEKISPRARIELGTARSVGQRLTHSATGAPRSSKLGTYTKRAALVSSLSNVFMLNSAEHKKFSIF